MSLSIALRWSSYLVLLAAFVVVAAVLIAQYGEATPAGQWWFRWYGFWSDGAGPANIQWTPVCSRNYC